MKFKLALLCIWGLALNAGAQQIQENDSIATKNLPQAEVSENQYDKYLPNENSPYIRTATPFLQLPQNIQIIGAEVLRDQNVYNINESVTRNVSGTFREELHNGISPDIYSRGGYINAQRNGVDLRPITKGPVADDVSMIEQIEFVKGASGFINSMSDPAGSYNIVTKKPDGIERKTVRLMAGSFDFFRAEADLSGKISPKLNYRLNLMGMNTKSFIDYDNNDRILIAPSVKYKINSKTSITAEYIYQRFNYMLLSEAQLSPFGYGTLPTNFSISDPSIRPYRATDHNIFLTLDRKLSKKWTWRTQVSNIKNNYNGSIFWVYGANKSNADTLNRHLVYDEVNYNVFSVQSFVSGKFKTGKTSHGVLTGIDYNRKNNATVDTWGTASAIYPLSISNPVYSQSVNNHGIGGDFWSENIIGDAQLNRTYGVLSYVSAHLMDEASLLDHRLRVTLGGRLTYSQGDFTQYGEVSQNRDLIFTPRLGVNYLINPSLSIYSLYDKTFLPQIGIAHDGTSLKPLRGSSLELGIKKDWSDGRWNSTFSVYDIHRNQMIIRDPASNLLHQAGATRSRGIEFDLRGRIVKGLHVISNYAFTDSKISEDEFNPERVGLPTPNRIRHIQNTWLNYFLPNQSLKGFNVSLGYQYLIGRAERFTTTTPTRLEDIFRIDVGVGYEKYPFHVKVMVNNIANSTDYSTAWRNGGGDMYYWVQQAPRNIRASITIQL